MVTAMGMDVKIQMLKFVTATTVLLISYHHHYHHTA